MTTCICDKCKARVKELNPTSDDYGNYELCDDCRKEIDKKLTDFHIAGIKKLKQDKVDLFNKWIGKTQVPKNNNPPPVPPKKWHQKIIGF